MVKGNHHTLTDIDGLTFPLAAGFGLNETKRPVGRFEINQKSAGKVKDRVLKVGVMQYNNTGTFRRL